MPSGWLWFNHFSTTMFSFHLPHVNLISFIVSVVSPPPIWFEYLDFSSRIIWCHIWVFIWFIWCYRLGFRPGLSGVTSEFSSGFSGVTSGFRLDYRCYIWILIWIFWCHIWIFVWVILVSKVFVWIIRCAWIFIWTIGISSGFSSGLSVSHLGSRPDCPVSHLDFHLGYPGCLVWVFILVLRF